MPAAAVAETFNAAEDTVEEGSEEDSQHPQQQAIESSAYLTFIERVSALCTLKRKDALDTSSSSSSTDSSDSGTTATASGKMARSSGGGRSWMSGRLGRSKKGSDQVRFGRVTF